MISVLFVCMGNICRSPAGEAIFRHHVLQRGSQGLIDCDSAGTLRDHQGERADPRMVKAAAGRGYDLRGRARQFRHEDFDRFDYIIAIDEYIHSVLSGWARDERDRSKILLIGKFHPDPGVVDVPDPYLGSSGHFERVLDILEVACGNLLDDLARRCDLPESGSSAES